jgi:hypothetical protein
MVFSSATSSPVAGKKSFSAPAIFAALYLRGPPAESFSIVATVVVVMPELHIRTKRIPAVLVTRWEKSSLTVTYFLGFSFLLRPVFFVRLCSFWL